MPTYNFQRTQNQPKYKHYHTKKSIAQHKNRQIKTYTKQKGTFTPSIIYLIPAAKVLKNLHSPSLLRTPKNTFPKTQVHLISNALAFSSKRKRVFYKALRGFLPNVSVFCPKSRFSHRFSRI